MTNGTTAVRRHPALTHFGVAAGIGVLGGLMGLGGAEFRLPYLVGVLGLSVRQAVPVNLAISLATLLAALPARAVSVSAGDLTPFAVEAASLAAGATVAAFVGAGWLHRLSDRWLSQAVLGLLVVLGVALIFEGLIEDAGTALIPDGTATRVACGFALGLGIGFVSSLLGVAGGEVIIPTLVFGFAAPIKAAGSLSLLVSLPTVGVGLARHVRRGMLDRSLTRAVVVPMAAGSALGAALGGSLLGLVPADALKLALGVALIWSARRAFGHHAA